MVALGGEVEAFIIAVVSEQIRKKSNDTMRSTRDTTMSRQLSLKRIGTSSGKLFAGTSPTVSGSPAPNRESQNSFDKRTY